jgi:hypothetical protein
MMKMSVQAAGVRKEMRRMIGNKRQRRKDGEDGDDPQLVTEEKEKKDTKHKKVKKDMERARE